MTTAIEQIAIFDPDANRWWHGDLTRQADIGGGAVFGHIDYLGGGLGRLAVVYYPADDLAFTVYDWQGVQPETPADIPLFTWRCGNTDALLINDRPVLPPWAEWNLPAQGNLVREFAAMQPEAQRFVLDVCTALAGLDDDQRRAALDHLVAAMEAQIASDSTMTSVKEKHPMKTRIDRQVAQKAVEYHAEDGEGLTPVIETDADLAEWLTYVLRQVGGFDEDYAIGVEIREDGVIIAGDGEVMQAVRTYLL